MRSQIILRDAQQMDWRDDADVALETEGTGRTLLLGDTRDEVIERVIDRHPTRDLQGQTPCGSEVGVAQMRYALGSGCSVGSARATLRHSTILGHSCAAALSTWAM